MKRINFPFNTPSQIYQTEKMMYELRHTKEHFLYQKKLNYNPYRYAKVGYKMPMPKFHNLKKALSDIGYSIKEFFVG